MRKILKMCFVAMMALIVKPTIAQEAITVTAVTNGYEIDFQMPEYTTSTINMAEEYGKNINYTNIEVQHQDFHEFANDFGAPTFAAFTISLPIPENAQNFSISATYDMSRYAAMLDDEDFKKLSYVPVPLQKDYALNETPTFTIKNAEYQSSNGFIYFNPMVADTFSIMGQRGVNITFCPFIYKISIKGLTAVKKTKLTFSYGPSNSSTPKTGMRLMAASSSSQSTIQNDEISETSINYINSIFNYTPISTSKSGLPTALYAADGSVSSKGNYLIIADDEIAKNNTIDYFANYKRNIGYDVTVVTTAQTGKTAEEIIKYIKNKYSDKSTRPDYVLLVGDSQKIPISGGKALDKENPPTDLYYARMSDSGKHRDIHLGRIPAETSIEACNAFNKIIFMERELKDKNKEMLILTGNISGDNLYSDFLNKNREIYHFGMMGYKKDLLEKPYMEDVESYLSTHNSTNLILYNGHGYSTGISIMSKSTYSNCPMYFDKCSSNYPIMFSLACLTGAYYEKKYFGSLIFTQNDKRCCAYVGASTNSTVRSDNVLMRYWFGDFINLIVSTQQKKDVDISAFTNINRLGEIFDYGIEKARKDLNTRRNKKKRPESYGDNVARRYNLFGDPSMYVRGIDKLSSIIFKQKEVFCANSKIEYKANNKIENQTSFTIKSGSDVTLTSGKNIVLGSGFKVEKGAKFKATIKQ